MIKQKPEQIVNDALDRVTAALLTLAMETLRSHSTDINGDVSEVVRGNVLKAFSKTLTLIENGEYLSPQSER
jgi:hypothetical protein